ncbi:O-antigen ligase family protein [Enterococcus sp. Edu-1]
MGILQMLTKKTLLIGSFSESILYTEGIVDSNRAVGIAGSNNSAGNLGALLFIIALFNLYRKKDLLSLSATMLTFLFILLTQTRIALLGIVPSLILIYTFNKSSTRSQFLKKSLLTISFVGISFLALFLLFDKIYQVFFLNRGNTENSRMIQFNNAINLGAKHHLLSGIGSGQWRSYLYNNFGIVDIPIHSQMLNYLVENGLFVFVVAIVFNIGILVTILKNSYLEKNYKLLALSLFFGNLIVSNFNPNQIYTINIIIYYLVMFYLAYYKKIKISKFKE